MVTDVLIAGAGIAGSAAALGFARQGRSVLLLDRSMFPREKACGEGLMPAGVESLARLGIQVEGAPFRGVRYHHAGRTVEGVFPSQQFGLGLRRWNLDAALLDAARAEKNVRVMTGVAVEAPLLAGRQVVGVRAGAEEFRAKLLVAADGANSMLRHKLGWDRSLRSRRYARVQHYRLPHAAPPWVDVYLVQGRETYVTPLVGHQLLVASLCDQHDGELGHQAAALPPELDALEPIGPTLGAAPLTVRASQRFAPGCVLLGDAAGNCDPITGGGMSQALLSAELLVQHADSLAAFDQAREKMLADYRLLTAGVLTLAKHPLLLRGALAILDHTPALFSRLLGVAGGSAA